MTFIGRKRDIMLIKCNENKMLHHEQYVYVTLLTICVGNYHYITDKRKAHI